MAHAIEFENFLIVLYSYSGTCTSSIFLNKTEVKLYVELGI